MPIYMDREAIDRFVFESRDSGDLVVSKTMDMTTTPLFPGHTGGVNAVFCDGSVRTLDVPPHTPEWTDFNSSDPGLLLPAVQGLLLPAVQHDFDL